MPFGLRLSSRAQDKPRQRRGMVEGYTRVIATSPVRSRARAALTASPAIFLHPQNLSQSARFALERRSLTI